MNIVKILLVLGLGYVALTQKAEKTRNMLLVVTGLLAFCMFSMEGFTVTFNDLTGFSGSDQTVSERTITVGSDAATQIVYTLPSSGTTYNSESPIPSTGYSCTIGGETGVMGKYTGADVQTVNIDDSSSGGPFDINKIFTCEAASTGPSDGEKGVSGPEADPCNCLTVTDGKNLYCNSGWMNSEILEYMDSDGKKTDKYEDAHKCWSGTLDFIPKLGDSFVGRCTKRAGSGDCTAPAATGGD